MNATFKMCAVLTTVLSAVLILAWFTRPVPQVAVPEWDEGLGFIGAPNAGLTYVKHPGRYYGPDYCSADGYGVPAGETDYEDGRNWVNDPDCRAR